MRVVLDTNVVVSAFLSKDGAPAQVIERWLRGAFEVVVTEPVLAEYARALTYSRVQARHGLSSQEIAEAVAGFRKFGVLVVPLEALHLVDVEPEEDKFIECAFSGAADYIITGDSHLLRLKEHKGIQILTPSVFLLAMK